MKLFCDRLAIRIPCRTPKVLQGNTWSETTPQGEIVTTFNKWAMVESEATHSARIAMRTMNYAEAIEPLVTTSMRNKTPLETAIHKRYGSDVSLSDVNHQGSLFLDISGNPTKFMNEGVNVWGCSNMRETITEFVCLQLQKQGFWDLMSAKQKRQVLDLNFYVTQFDFTTNLKFKTEQDMKEFLDVLNAQAEAKHSKKSTTHGSCYFGSRNWIRTVFYDKSKEVLANSKKLKLKNSMNDDEKKRVILQQNKVAEAVLYAQNLVRFEVRIGKDYIRDKKLKKLKDLIDHLEETEIVTSQGKEIERNVFMNKRLEALNLGQMPLNNDEIEQAKNTVDRLADAGEIAKSCKGTFRIWMTGQNPREVVSKATFYRHRKEILEAVFIDINCIRQDELERREAAKKVVPLIRVIEASFAAPCENAMKHIHQPNADRFRQDLGLRAVNG